MAKDLDIVDRQLELGMVKAITTGSILNYVELLFNLNIKSQFYFNLDYELTNRKVCLNNNDYFSRDGTMILTISFDAFNTNEDKCVLMDNGQEVWICNYKDVDTSTPLPPSLPQEGNEATDLRAIISGNTNLKNGLSRTYTVAFTDKSGNEVDWNDVNFKWNVATDFDVGLIEQTVNENTIKLSVDDNSFIGESFLLSVLIGDSVAAKVSIDIIEGF